MTHKDIYLELVRRIDMQVEEIKTEIREICDKHKDDANNSGHLVTITETLLSDKKSNFIDDYKFTCGIEELIGTDYNKKASDYISESIYKVMNYHQEYSESLYH